MKRICVCLCVLLLLCFCASSCAEKEIPQCLRFTQALTVTQLPYDRIQYITLPSTSLPQVDLEIAEVIGNLYAAAVPYLAEKGAWSEYNDRIDVGPYITRVGERWMSFLSIGRVSHGIEQVFVAFDARVYDMETGSRVYLDSIIDEEKGGWDYLSAEVRKQLSAHFPALEPDAGLLASLCTRDALMETGFTLSPGHISLHWHAHTLYPEAPAGLLRVDIYYPDLKPYMTETAIRETDCSEYALAALTYDDGPGRNSSDALMNQLRLFGAEATFFAVGNRMHELPCVLHREYDAGYSVQSHNWVHDTKIVPTEEELAEWILLTDEELSAIIGVGPTMMRSPGGSEKNYINAGVTLPMIHWSLISGDSDPSMQNNVGEVARHTAYTRNGDIVLAHDYNGKAGMYAQGYLPKLTNDRNFLLVTVQDLCALRGVELLPAVVYNSCPPDQ